MMKIFLDEAELGLMTVAYKCKMVQGFTTNPTLMRAAGVTNYLDYVKEALCEIPDMPISFEVLSGTISHMEREARVLSGWGENVYVKIPVVDTKGTSCLPLIQKLSNEEMNPNVTAVYTTKQVKEIKNVLCPGVPAIISVFAGRIADTGTNPVPTIIDAAGILKDTPDIELLWASTREVYNIIQAEACGCDIITIPVSILRKMSLIGKDIEKLSVETVRQFSLDAKLAGYYL